MQYIPVLLFYFDERYEMFMNNCIPNIVSLRTSSLVSHSKSIGTLVRQRCGRKISANRNIWSLLKSFQRICITHKSDTVFDLEGKFLQDYEEKERVSVMESHNW